MPYAAEYVFLQLKPQDRLKRFFKILRRTFLVLVAIILLIFIAIQTGFVQNWLVNMVAGKLSKALGTEVRVQNVSFSLFNRLNLEGTLIRDKQKDTLLYAGQLKVRVTDWFFLKDKAVLKYVGLENAVIKMQRRDSVWNYKFIVDYFSSPAPKKKNSSSLDLNLKKVDLKNVRFIKDDLWAGEHMDIFTGSLLVDAETVDFKKNIFTINTVELEKPFVRIQSLKALRPDSLRRHASADSSGKYAAGNDITLYLSKLTINNGNLFLDSDQDMPSSHFDGSHIHLSKLTGSIQNIRIQKDTIRANIDLAVNDRCGLQVKKLKASFRFTPQIMELDKLDLQTNKSRLTNYYAMKFKDFNKDFGKYTGNVTMVAHFIDAKINSDDIAYFAPDLKTWKREVILGGNFAGTVEDFTMNNLSAKIGATTRVSGMLHMKGLPDIDQTKIELNNGSLQTNYYDLGILIPSLKGVTSPNLAALGTVIYRGNFNGTIHNFITAGNFSTQLGGVKTNISLQLPKKAEPTYTGDIEMTRFNIGKFLKDTSLGLVDFKGKIIGSNFSIDNLKTTIEGKVSSLEYNNYTYTNIITNGTFQKKYFSGELKIDDPNLDFTSTVEIDLSKDLPRFNIVGDLVHSNLRVLNLSTDSLELTGLLDVNFSGTNIDNFLGTAKFLNADIKSGNNTISFDSLNLTSNYIDSVKSLHLGSNDFNATIEGKFSINDLSASFQSFLTRYFPAYIKQPRSIPQNQYFSFKINTGDVEEYLPFIDKHFSGFNDASISGSVDTRSNQLSLTAAVPLVQYNNLVFTGVDLKGKGTIDSLSLTGNIASIQVGDSMQFPNTRLHVVAQQDHSIVSLKTSANNTLNDADLLADVYTLSDGVRVQFRPSSFVLNEKKWTVEKAGEITIRTHLIDAQNVKFTQGFQEITVEKVPSFNPDQINNLAVHLKTVVLGDITSLFFKTPRLEGIASGTLLLNDLTGNIHPVGDLKVEQFRLDDDSIGLVNLKTDVDLKAGNIPFTIESPNEGYHFTAKGNFNLKDTTHKPLTSEIDLDNSKIDIVHKFLGDIFTDIKGQATGILHINGDISSPDLLGNIKLHKASMKVNYTQVVYSIDSANINFKEDGIDFGTFAIHDRYKNTGTISGKLLEKEFKNMVFDFELKSDKLLVLDTKSTDNQQFYGKAIGKVTSLRFSGPETDAQLKIVADANDSSHIYIPNSVSRESGLADFIVFKQYGTEMIKESSGGNFNLTVDLDVTANNKVMIDVILDELTGDVIKATGNGKLSIHAGTIDPLTIRGQYNIERGSYNFNFQNFVRKPFLLLPDAGNYIKWTGDPFRADIHIDAQYTAERVSLNDLVGNLGLSSAVKGYRGDVYVIARLSEKLNHPTIRFRLDFPQGSPVKSDNEFAQYLARLENDQNEILNQVAFLILFNSFAPPSNSNNNTANSPYSITSIGVNTISAVLTKSINKVVSNLLYKITRDKSLRFDVGTSIYSSSSLINPTGDLSSSTGTNRLDRTRVDLKLGYAFANDKIVVTLGSDIDVNLGSSAITNGNTQWLPNVNIEFVLTKDKKLRLIVFNKNSLDLSGSTFGRRNRQGASISYRKDFETFFGRKEKDVEIKAPADSTKGN